MLFGAASFALGLADSVALVWAASVYANAVSDWTASEAATPTTDPAVLERLDRIEALLAERLPAP